MTDVLDTPTNTDEATIRQLHDAFVAANRVGDSEFLKMHMVPGPDRLLWYNLNQSNYIGVDHIVELWDFLRAIVESTTGSALINTWDDNVTVIGECAIVTYMLHMEADFGAMGLINQDARSTEVWQRLDGEWKMIHFHCSNYVPGIMGGK